MMKHLVLICSLIFGFSSLGKAQSFDPMQFSETEVLEMLLWEGHVRSEDPEKMFYIQQQILMSLVGDLSSATFGVLQDEGVQRTETNYFDGRRRYWGSREDLKGRYWLKLSACLYTRLFYFEGLPSRRQLIEQLDSSESEEGKEKIKNALAVAIEDTFHFFECDKDPQIELHRQKLLNISIEKRKPGVPVPSTDPHKIDPSKPFT